MVHFRDKHSWHASFQPCPGVWVVCFCLFFSKKRKNKFEQQAKEVECKTPKVCTYIQIIAFLTRYQIKTHVSTQIHKCKRSVNRLFKGYLLYIYMKYKGGYSFSDAGLGNQITQPNRWLSKWPMVGEKHLQMIKYYISGLDKHDVPLETN